MAIVQLDKVTLYGVAHQRDQVLTDLQALGCIHLVNLQAVEPPTVEHPTRSEVHDALEYLEGCPVQRATSVRRKDFNCVEVTRQALAIKERRQALSDERDFLLRSTEALRPWGDFRLPPDGELGPLRFWYYTLKHYQVDSLRKTELSWRVVAEDNQYAYVVVIDADQPQDMPTAPLDLDRRPLSELTACLESVEEELDELHWKRIALTRWSRLLAEELEAADDEFVRMEACHRTLVDGDIFALQGWLPRAEKKRLQNFARQHELAMTVHAPSREETPPTLLKNPESVAGAEGAVTFYITPNYYTWDPTWIVYFSFAFFFAMIMSDAGYGLLLGGLLAFYLWRKLGSSLTAVRFRNLLVAVVAFTVLYGVLIGSYFGVSPGEGTLLDAAQIRIRGQSLMTEENQNTMMVIAITIGVFHLALANLVSAWQRRDSSQCLGSLGWAAGLLSGLVLGIVTMMDPNPLSTGLAWLAGLPYRQCQDILHQAARWTLIGSAVAIFAFSSSRPLYSLRIGDWAWRSLDGLQALTGVSKAFGDVLSYLRLFALGLASAQLAITFNDLARGAAEMRGVGILLAVLILIAGHSIHMLLGIVSGVVHGLRLNCIEFFSWSLTDEGYPFQAFRKKAGC